MNDMIKRIIANRKVKSFVDDPISPLTVKPPIYNVPRPDSPWVMYFGPVYKHPFKMQMVDLPENSIFVSVQSGMPVYRHPSVGTPNDRT